MAKTVQIQTKDSSVQTIIDQVREQIAIRAQQIAAERGYQTNPLENWVAAESQLFWKPEAQLQESEDAFIAKFRLPEVQADDVQVYLDPQSVIIMGTKTGGSNNGTQVRYSDFRYGQIYREIPLPEPIDPDKAKAKLTEGVLVVSLPKPRPEVKPKPPQASARSRKAKPKKDQ
jgi:HSP20 family molecular chaperone IbpA